MRPQARRVLRHLKDAGTAGIHSRDLRADWIADPPTRVCELLRLGYEISREKRGNGTHYTLRSGPDGLGAAPRRAASAEPTGPHTRSVAVPGMGGGGSLAPAARPSFGERRPYSKLTPRTHLPTDHVGWVRLYDFTGEDDWAGWEFRPDRSRVAA